MWSGVRNWTVWNVGDAVIEDQKVSDTADKVLTAEERARRKAVVTAMLADRDRRRPIAVEDILQARDEDRR